MSEWLKFSKIRIPADASREIQLAFQQFNQMVDKLVETINFSTEAVKLDDGTHIVTAEDARHHIDSTANPHSVTATQTAVTASGFVGNLSAADDTTQKALATLDGIRAMRTVQSAVIDHTDWTDLGGGYGEKTNIFTIPKDSFYFGTKWDWTEAPATSVYESGMAFAIGDNYTQNRFSTNGGYGYTFPASIGYSFQIPLNYGSPAGDCVVTVNTSVHLYATMYDEGGLFAHFKAAGGAGKVQITSYYWKL